MGKYKSKRNKNKQAEKPAKPARDPSQFQLDPRDKPEQELTNAAFEQYYKAMGITETEEEWAEFMKSLRAPLPTTFRVTGSRSYVWPMLIGSKISWMLYRVAQELNGVVQDVYGQYWPAE